MCKPRLIALSLRQVREPLSLDALVDDGRNRKFDDVHEVAGVYNLRLKRIQ